MRRRHVQRQAHQHCQRTLQHQQQQQQQFRGTFLVFVCIPCQAATRVQWAQKPLPTTSTAADTAQVKQFV